MKTAGWTIAGILVAALAALAVLAQEPGTATATAPEAQALKPVKLLRVAPQERTLTRQFFGKVVARRTVDLAFQVGGQIQSFPVIEGTLIRTGDLVAELDLRPFELALERARLQKAQADRTFDRLTKLKDTTVSQVAIEDAETAADLAEIAVEDAEIALKDATLLAPFDSLVASRSVENFTTIAPGTPVVRLHDMSELRVEIDLPEVLVQRASIADNLRVTARFPTSDEVYDLTVRELNAETSTIGQTYRATFGMEMPEGLSVLPGSSVTVTATLRNEGPGIIIPASAVAIASDGATSVFLFRPAGGDEGSLTRTPVTLVPTETGEMRVTAGVDAGEEIVVAGVTTLSDGTAARRFTGFGS